MTAHFKGGPWNGLSKYLSCEKGHNHTITVKDPLAVYEHSGHYEIDGNPVSAEVFDELLVDVVYFWVDWTES